MISTAADFPTNSGEPDFRSLPQRSTGFLIMPMQHKKSLRCLGWILIFQKQRSAGSSVSSSCCNESIDDREQFFSGRFGAFLAEHGEHIQLDRITLIVFAKQDIVGAKTEQL